MIGWFTTFNIRLWFDDRGISIGWADILIQNLCMMFIISIFIRWSAAKQWLMNRAVDIVLIWWRKLVYVLRWHLLLLAHCRVSFVLAHKGWLRCRCCDSHTGGSCANLQDFSLNGSGEGHFRWALLMIVFYQIYFWRISIVKVDLLFLISIHTLLKRWLSLMVSHMLRLYLSFLVVHHILFAMTACFG